MKFWIMVLTFLFLVCALSVCGFFDSPAHAGWWSDFCERHIIADDPTQFESVETSWIEWKIYVLEIKARNKVADGAELRLLAGLRKEIERRENGL